MWIHALYIHCSPQFRASGFVVALLQPLIWTDVCGLMLIAQNWWNEVHGKGPGSLEHDDDDFKNSTAGQTICNEQEENVRKQMCSPAQQ